jgi:2-oxo-4-hydroxy-4-carboxy--5-ureidoimidazoline (OHCU) decarboxylase
MTKIELKNSIYSHRHFTEHLMDVFRKPPWECNSDYKTESFDPTTQEGTGFNKQVLSTSRENKSQPHRTHLELGATAELNK